jgi:dTDP-4-amino-4,6-dideoxygalactose transaminase
LLKTGFNEEEKRGKMPDKFPRKLSNALAAPIVEELKGLDTNLEHRKKVSKIYEDKLCKLDNVLIKCIENDNRENKIPFVRYPILITNSVLRDKLENHLKAENIYVGRWYTPHIFPEGTSLKDMGYQIGTAPNAENISSRILNLPTNPGLSSEKAEEIAEIVTNFLEKYDEG